MKEKLLASKENVELSYFLGKINKEVPIDTDLSKYTVDDGNMAEAAKIMTGLELFGLMEKMNINASNVGKPT